MLEGGGEKSWYLWGFSSPTGSSYFETHDTRSGDVASELLVNSQCEYLMSDVFSGYRKAVRETNKVKMAQGQPLIKNIFCAYNIFFYTTCAILYIILVAKHEQKKNI